MVSEAALARKKQFMKLKQEHGDFSGLQKHLDNLSWNVWYNDIGDIISISKEPNKDLSKRYKCSIFTNEQVKILENKNWNLYKVTVDKYNDGVVFIEAKAVEQFKVSSTTDFLHQIEFGAKKGYDFKIEITKNKFIITLNQRLVTKYKSIGASTASINGKKRIPFYITSNNDPSFLFHTVYVSLPKLVEQKELEIMLPSNFKSFSVYTEKLFNNYYRVGEY